MSVLANFILTFLLLFLVFLAVNIVFRGLRWCIKKIRGKKGDRLA